MASHSERSGRLCGKIAIVTGGGAPEGGIGRAIGQIFAAQGAAVVLADIDHDRAQEAADSIRATGGIAFPIAGDVSQPDECRHIVDVATQSFGVPTILVNNVGLSQSARSLIQLDMMEWQRVMNANLKSAVAMSAHILPTMKAAGGGSIVNIASIAAMHAYGGAAYGPSKAALIAFTRETAVMHGRDGIRANVIAPGHISSPHVSQMMTPELMATRRDIGPLGIEGNAADVANAALFLASDEARFITGALLPVDGGVTAIGPMAAHDLIVQSQLS